MTYPSPDQAASHASQSQSPPDGSGLSANSPGMGFLKTLTGGKTISRSNDSSQPKKRGPKPDSRPALTRRQELNRQAQRTHRERKELYVKSLEDEVVRLKDVYGTAVVHREQAVTENKKLRAILAKHGIAGPPAIRVTPTQPPQSQEQSQEQPQKQPQKQQAPTNGLPEIKSQPMVNGAGLHSSVQSAGV